MGLVSSTLWEIWRGVKGSDGASGKGTLSLQCSRTVYSQVWSRLNSYINSMVITQEIVRPAEFQPDPQSQTY